MKKKILAVDDEPNNTRLFSIALAGDYEVIVANSGEGALQAAARHKPHLILLDIMMPGMDGFVVCEKLKENPETAAIPVVFVTAENNSDSEVHGLEIGGEDYITKPFSISVLKLRVKHILERVQITNYLECLVDGLEIENVVGEEKTPTDG